jgi:hypothetical protein
MSAPTLEAAAVNTSTEGREGSTGPASRRRGIIITTVVASLIAAGFYVGFIVMMVMRAIH